MATTNPAPFFRPVVLLSLIFSLWFLAPLAAQDRALPKTPAATNTPPAKSVPIKTAVPPVKTDPAKADGDIKKTGLTSVEPFPAIPDGKVRVKIEAQVNGKPIFEEEVRAMAYPFLLRIPEPQRTSQTIEFIKQQALQQLIDQEVLLQEVYTKVKAKSKYMDKLKEAAGKEFGRQVRDLKKANNIQTDEDFKNALRSQGLSIEAYRRQTEDAFLAMEFLRSQVWPMVGRVGHRQVWEYYEKHPEEFQTVDSVRWLDIFIDVAKFKSREDARTFAEQLAAKARAGEDFAKLAVHDCGDGALRKGEGLGQRRGEIRPSEAENLLFQMRDNEVGPVVELATGFHVIKLVKRVHAGPMPLDEKLQNTILRKLQNQIAEREQKRLLNELKRKATIEIAGKTAG